MSKNKDENKKTDALIDQLCGELSPVKCCCPYRRIFPWFLFSALYLVGSVWYLDLRHDFSERLMDSTYLFETGLGLGLFISAALASSFLCMPDSGQKGWIKAVPLTFFGVFAFWIGVRSFEEGEALSATLHLVHCAREGVIMEAVPIVFLVFMTMRGRTTQPYWSMVMNILAVAALGWIGLRLTCSMDQMGHSFINHLLPFAVLAAGLGFFARRLFKW